LQDKVPRSWHQDDRILKKFLSSLNIPKVVETIDPIPTVILADKLKKGFTSLNERTTTSPSGRHLGHYKAVIQDPELLK
jgi:hypothetical protein